MAGAHGDVVTAQARGPVVHRPPRLARILDLVPDGTDTFEGAASANWTGTVFGGLVVAQAAAAAARTVAPDRVLHGVQGRFLRPGSGDTPLVHRVERVRDGRSFSHRSVSVEQRGQVIFTLAASFHVPEDGFAHQTQPFDAPGPEALPSLTEALAGADEAAQEWLDGVLERMPFEVRVAGEMPQVRWARGEAALPTQRFWFRPLEAIPPDDRLLATGALLHASDHFLLSASLTRHGTPLAGLQFASLDHNVWLHRPVDFGDWLLYEQEGLWAGGGRALCRGTFFDRRGDVVANVVQEGLIRPLPAG